MAFSAHGSGLKIGDGQNPENFALVADVAEIQWPTLERDAIEVTSYSSPGATRQYIAGLRKYSAGSVTVYWDPTNAVHNRLATLAKTGAIVNLILVRADGKQNPAFPAFFVKREDETPLDDAHKVTFEFHPTGVVDLETWT